MFDNIGEKIKLASKILFFLCSLGCVIAGIVLWSEMESPIFVILILGGPIVSYLLALLLYGFGEIVDKITNINYKIQATAIEAKKVNKPVEKVTSIDSKIQTNDIEEKKVNKPVERYWCGKCEHPGPYDGNCPKCGSSIKIYF